VAYSTFGQRVHGRRTDFTPSREYTMPGRTAVVLKIAVIHISAWPPAMYNGRSSNT
jgi:hypothetical protein